MRLSIEVTHARAIIGRALGFLFTGPEPLGSIKIVALSSTNFRSVADFGDARVWEAGFIRDVAVREAFADLVSKGYIAEYIAAVELTLKGYAILHGGLLREALKVENVQDALLAILDVIDALRSDLDTLTKVVTNAGTDAPSFRAVVETKESAERDAPMYIQSLRAYIKNLNTPK